MRFSLLALLAGSATLAGAQSFKGKKTKEPTVFNSIEVPPLLELTPTNWEEEIKKSKFLFVKHYR
jgi:protein disulfide-isomerase